MALRDLSIVLALGLLISSGCKSSSNYRSPCQQPAVVATTPVPPPPCAGAPVVPPPPGAPVVVVPR
jgi:hypothetical protein